MLFNEKLKMLRKENDLTQEQLAEELNVSRQAITKWESGDGIPDIENLKQISILFNKTLDELIMEDKDVNVENVNKSTYIEEMEIDHTKYFDVNVCSNYELNLTLITEEKVKIELLSSEEEKICDVFKIKFDNSYNKLDIDIKSKKQVDDVVINIYLPKKYINDIELNSKTKTLNVYNFVSGSLEYDGELKYLNVRNSKGSIVLNTTKCDVEVNYDKFDGLLEVNIVNSTARVEVPTGTEYKTILKGIKNEFVDVVHTENSNNTIELNGKNSKLMVIEY